MSDEPTMCGEPVCPPPYFHNYACRNKAKWLVEWAGAPRPVCGQHVRWHRKHGTVIGEIGAGAGLHPGGTPK